MKSKICLCNVFFKRYRGDTLVIQNGIILSSRALSCHEQKSPYILQIEKARLPKKPNSCWEVKEDIK